MTFDIISVVVTGNTVVLAGILVTVGKYIQRLETCEKNVEELASQKNEVAHAELSTKVEGLAHAVSEVKRDVREIAVSLGLRHNRVEATD